MKKVLIYSDPTWAINRIHHDIELYIKDEFEFTYIAYTDQLYIKEQINDIFINKKINLEYDIILTSMWVYYILRDNYPSINLNNWSFTAHGSLEIKDNNLSNLTTFASTSDSLLELYPTNINVFVTPNGVEPTNFIYKVLDYKPTAKEIKKINGIDTKSKIKDRIEAIKNAGGKLIFTTLDVAFE